MEENAGQVLISRLGHVEQSARLEHVFLTEVQSLLHDGRKMEAGNLLAKAVEVRRASPSVTT